MLSTKCGIFLIEAPPLRIIADNLKNAQHDYVITLSLQRCIRILQRMSISLTMETKIKETINGFMGYKTHLHRQNRSLSNL